MAISSSPTAAHLGAVVVPLTGDYLNQARELVDQVLLMTKSIYSGDITCEEQEDDEIAGDRHFLLRVSDSGDVDAIFARHNQWHMRLVDFPTGVRTRFRLLI